MQKADLTIVIPTFNEKANLELLVPSLEDAFKGISNIEILIADEYTGDGTEELLEGLNKIYGNIRVLTQKDKSGIAMAWQGGFKLAKSDFIGCMDGDLSHDPAYMVEMYKAMKEKKCDMIIGSRYLNGFWEYHGKKFIPVFLSTTGQYLARFILSLKLKDLSHSFRIFRKDLFDRIKDDLSCQGNSYMVQFSYLASKNRFNICEIPIIYRKRMHGQTKLKVFKEGVRYIYSLLFMRFKKI
ncbi:MAG: glycosyltransferase [Candidatus Omnitrophica bacterium]|nr:glycosyltransferase [Candidatus Omnitrophota bacterium]